MAINPLYVIYYAVNSNPFQNAVDSVTNVGQDAAQNTASSSNPLTNVGQNAAQSAAQGTANTTAFNLTYLENWLTNLIIAAAFLMFVLAIFTYISSGGEPKKVGKAKEYLLSAVTALVALVLVKMFITHP